MAWTRDDKLTAFTALVEGTEGLELKGKATSYTSRNGNMFAFLSPEGTLAFRVPDAERTRTLEADPSTKVLQHGRVMKHYVAVTDAVLDDLDELRSLWDRAIAHAAQLKPKATKRKKR